MKHVRKEPLGYTLVEIMVVVAVLAIILVAATITYQDYVTKSRRTEAIHTLLSLQMAQENYRATHNRYGNLKQIWGNQKETENGYYRLNAYYLSGTTYALLAQGLKSQRKDREDNTSCRYLYLWKINGNEYKYPIPCWKQ